MNCIYPLSINDYPVYIGKTTDIQKRYKEHYSNCYNENDRHFNRRLYKTIRQIGIDKNQFKTYIKINVLYQNVPNNYSGIMEDLDINSYREIGNFNILNECLAVELGIRIDCMVLVEEYVVNYIPVAPLKLLKDFI